MLQVFYKDINLVIKDLKICFKGRNVTVIIKNTQSPTKIVILSFIPTPNNPQRLCTLPRIAITILTVAILILYPLLPNHYKTRQFPVFTYYTINLHGKNNNDSTANYQINFSFSFKTIPDKNYDNDVKLNTTPIFETNTYQTQDLDT